MSHPFHDFYALNLRAGLFTGFLTLSGFLLAMKTLVVIQLRKELYDTPHYRKLVATRRELNSGLTIYGPLRRFGRALLAAICLSVTTSISQFTIGLYPSDCSAWVCLCLALLTAASIGVVLSILWLNLGDLFAFWESEGNEKLAKENASNSVPRT